MLASSQEAQILNRATEQLSQGTVSVREILKYFDRDRYFSLSDSVDYLCLSERTIRGLLDEIPHFRVGKKLLFKKSELDLWMEHCREDKGDPDVKQIADEVVERLLG